MGTSPQPTARRRPPPGLDSLRYFAGPDRFLHTLHRRYGDRVPLTLNGTPFTALFAPAAVHAVTVTEADAFHKGMGYGQMRKMLGNGLFTAEDPDHHTHRRILLPGFTQHTAAGHLDTVTRYVRRHTGTLDGDVNTGDWAGRLTLDIMIATTLGDDPDRWPPGLADAVRAATDAATDAVRLRITPTRTDPVGDAAATLRRIAHTIVERPAPPGSVIRLLRTGRTGDGRPLPDLQILDETLTVILAGYETTAHTIAFLLARLADHPVWQQLLADTARQAGWRPDTTVDADVLRRVEPVRWFIDETLRLDPVAWLLPRRAVRDVTVDGVDLPAGRHVLISQYVTHRHPDVWPNPERFSPARWDRIRDHDLPAGAYFPFGAGGRLCIGRHLALAVAAITVVETVTRHRIERHHRRRRNTTRLLHHPHRHTTLTFRPAT